MTPDPRHHPKAVSCPPPQNRAPARSRDHASGRHAGKDLRSAPNRARHVESKPNRRRAAHDDLTSAQITISVEQASPGSPLDERLRREQTRALLDLLVDIAARRKAKAGRPKQG